jgi:drug/metabolite transporter (DMT)-like permease
LEPHKGDLLILLAVISWALYVLLVRRIGNRIHPLSLLTSVMFLGGLQLLPLALLEAHYVQPVVPDAMMIGTVLYLTLVASIAAVFCWNRAILGLGHARAGLFTHLMPVFSVILAVLVLGERPQPFHGAGTLFIVVGLYLSTVWAAALRSGPAASDARP